MLPSAQVDDPAVMQRLHDSESMLQKLNVSNETLYQRLEANERLFQQVGNSINKIKTDSANSSLLKSKIEEIDFANSRVQKLTQQIADLQQNHDLTLQNFSLEKEDLIRSQFESAEKFKRSDEVCNILRKQLQDREEQMTKVSEIRSAVEGKGIRLQDELSQTRTVNQQLNDELAKAVSGLQTESRLRREETGSLKDKLGKMNADLSKTSQQLSVVSEQGQIDRKRLIDIGNQLEDVNCHYRDSSIQVTDLTNRLMMTRGEIESAGAEKNESQRRAVGLESLLKETQKSLIQTAAEVNGLTTRVTAMRDQIVLKDSSIASLEKIKTDLQSRLSEITVQATEFRSLSSDQLKEIQRLRNEMNNQVESIRNTAVASKHVSDAAKQNENRLEADVNRLIAELDKMRADGRACDYNASQRLMECERRREEQVTEYCLKFSDAESKWRNKESELNMRLVDLDAGMEEIKSDKDRNMGLLTQKLEQSMHLERGLEDELERRLHELRAAHDEIDNLSKHASAEKTKREVSESALRVKEDTFRNALDAEKQKNRLEMSRCQSRVSELERDKQDMLIEIQNMSRELEFSKSLVKKVNEELSSSQSMLQECQNQFHKKQADISSLNEDLASLNRKIQDSTEIAKRLQAEGTKRSQDYERDVRELKRSATEKILEAQQECQRLQDQIQSLLAEKEVNEQSYHNLKEVMMSVQNEIMTKDSDFKQVMGKVELQIAELQQQSMIWQSKARNLQEVKDKLESELMTSRMETQQAVNELNKISSRLRDSESRFNVMGQKISDLQEQFNRSQSDVSQWKEQASTQEEELKRRADMIKKLEEDIDSNQNSSMTESRELKSKLSGHSRQIEQMSEELEDAAREISNLRNANTQLQATIQTTVAGFIEQMQRMEEQVEKERFKVKEEQKMKVEDMQEMKSICQKKTNEMESNIRQLEAEKESLERRLREIESSLQREESSKEEAETRSKELDQQLRTVRQSYLQQSHDFIVLQHQAEELKQLSGRLQQLHKRESDASSMSSSSSSQHLSMPKLMSSTAPTNYSMSSQQNYSNPVSYMPHTELSGLPSTRYNSATVDHSDRMPSYDSPSLTLPQLDHNMNIPNDRQFNRYSSSLPPQFPAIGSPSMFNEEAGVESSIKKTAEFLERRRNRSGVQFDTNIAQSMTDRSLDILDSPTLMHDLPSSFAMTDYEPVKNVRVPSRAAPRKGGKK